MRLLKSWEYWTLVGVNTIGYQLPKAWYGVVVSFMVILLLMFYLNVKDARESATKG